MSQYVTNYYSCHSCHSCHSCSSKNEYLVVAFNTYFSEISACFWHLADLGADEERITIKGNLSINVQ